MKNLQIYLSNAHKGVKERKGDGKDPRGDQWTTTLVPPGDLIEI